MYCIQLKMHIALYYILGTSTQVVNKYNYYQMIVRDAYQNYILYHSLRMRLIFQRIIFNRCYLIQKKNYAKNKYIYKNCSYVKIDLTQKIETSNFELNLFAINKI